MDSPGKKSLHREVGWMDRDLWCCADARLAGLISRTYDWTLYAQRPTVPTTGLAEACGWERPVGQMILDYWLGKSGESVIPGG